MADHFHRLPDRAVDILNQGMIGVKENEQWQGHEQAAQRIRSASDALALH